MSCILRGRGYPGMFLTMGFGWLLLVALLVPSWKIVVAYFLAYLFLRLTVAWVAGVCGLRDPVVKANLWLVPLRDALNVGLYVASFFSDKMEWRGTRYRIVGRSMVSLDLSEIGTRSARVKA